MRWANSLLLFAQEHGGETDLDYAEEPSGIDLVLPATEELLWGFICFVIVLTVLSRIAFPKIRESIEKREAAQRQALEETERARSEANKLLEDYRAQLAEARSEGNRVIEEARQSAEQVRRDLVARAEQDAEGIVARAQEQIQAERTRTIQELQSSIAEMSIQLAEKVVGRSLDPGSQKELVDAYIREVAGGGNGATKS